MGKYYLAVDIGASGGRHIVGWTDHGTIKTQEIYRFSNEMISEHGTLCWNTEQLFEEIVEGLKRCGKIGMIPSSMAIDTWAVDYVLLDKQGRKLGKSVGYRDKRTKGMDLKVERLISEEELYHRTGIQKQPFNTIYQLKAQQEMEKEILEQAEQLLMMPDYFNYLLTGKCMQEYTNATTTQLVNHTSKTWDMELIGRLEFPDKLFGTLFMPGTVVGSLMPAVIKKVGFDCQVVMAASHDTASAVMAVPAKQQEMLYISSGTWSLMGTELKSADCREICRLENFTNEGGYEYRFRFLKNIMGLWMIQSVKKEWEKAGKNYSFEEICSRASKQVISSIVNCNEERFLAPESMEKEIREFCRETNQPVPQTCWETAAVIYNSLAVCYGECVKELEYLTGHIYPAIYIVGGGSNAEHLNWLTAKCTGKTVYAGPSEATAVGNLAAQMLRAGEYNSLEEVRESISRSFKINIYQA